MKNNYTLFFIALVAIACSCKKEFKSETEFNQWINDSENELKKVQNTGGISFIAKFLPEQFLIKKEIRNTQKKDEAIIKKITDSYNGSLCFLLTIKPDSIDNEVDLMKSGVKNYEEYKQRFLSMNFDLGENIKLKIDDKEISPTLFNVENTYGLSNELNINIVFDKKQIEKSQTEKMDLIFTDDYFETGIHHFVFQKNKLVDLPEFNY